MGYRTGVLRQQTVPGAARPPGVERAERGAGAPDGVVRGDTDGAVVCGRWPCRCAGGKGPPLVCPSGGADVQRYAGGAAAPDVAVPRFRAFGCRGALAGMRRNATPDAFRSGVEVRKTSLTRLIAGATKKVFLIVDHLSVHEAAVVDQWLSDTTDRIEVFSLPKSAPERNP